MAVRIFVGFATNSFLPCACGSFKSYLSFGQTRKSFVEEIAMLNARATLTLTGAVVFFCALHAPAGIIWYTTEAQASDGWAHLYSMDTKTSTITDRGEIHGQRYITDLAMDDDETLYAVGWNNPHALGSSKLYKITPGDEDNWAGWEIVTVKSNNMARTVNAAAMLDGDLYIASSSGELQKLNYDVSHNYWEVTKTGRLGYYSGGDLSFSPEGETLYIALADGYLGSVDFDQGSGDFGKVSIIGDSGCDELFGLATVDGRLYATTNSSDRYTHSSLVSVNTDTAEVSDSIMLDRFAWGAVGDIYTVIPEPTSAALLLLGGVFVILRRRNRMT
jgi:hypothetical protein